jgi:ABC-2 type transport system permease protein
VIMLRAIALVELRSLARDRAVWLVLVSFAALTAYAAANGARFAREERREIARIHAAEQARIAALHESGRMHAGPRDPGQIARELGRRAASLPVAPLAAVSVGQRDLLPHTIFLSLDARPVEHTKDAGKSAAQLASGPFDLAFVFVFLLPLVVIALGYDLLSSEREQGTLALVLSQPISPARFLATKAGVRAALVVALVVVPGWLASLLTADGLVGLVRAPVGLAAYAALLLCYTGFWFAAAVSVNALGRSSAENALALVALWLACVMIVPGLVSVAVDALHPSPSRVSLVNASRAAARDVESQGSALEGDHGSANVAAAGTRVVQLQQDMERKLQPIVASFREQLERQQRLVDGLRYLSPALVLSEGLNDVAGSGVRRHQLFTAQVEHFQAAYRRFFIERARANQGEARTAGDQAPWPRFEYREPAWTASASRVGASILGLLGPTIVLLVGAVMALRRTLRRGLR